MVYSKLVRNFEKVQVNFFFFLTYYKEDIWLFLFYVAKSISFQVISVLKISTFAGKLIILWPLLQFLS